MTSYQKLCSRFSLWFTIGMVGVFVLSVVLRFWGLGRFNTLVFDEIYYAKFANQYLNHTPLFDLHPPLGKYLIAIGIWISTHTPLFQNFLQDLPKNDLSGAVLSPVSYRWLNALTGSLIPLLVGAIAYSLSHHRIFAFVASLFAATDGFFLVESRYALINIYLIFFGLLAQWLFLIALSSRTRRSFWLMLSGVSFGACISIKWNGLGFILGIYLVWLAVWVIRLVKGLVLRWRERHNARVTSLLSAKQSNSEQNHFHHLVHHLSQLNILSLLFYLGALPLLIYSLIWIPHLQINAQVSLLAFWEIHTEILERHEQIGNGPDVHPYCSAWYTWALMLRPIAYFYKTAASPAEPILAQGPPLPSGAVKVIYDVHAMGNPLLWWLATTAILLLIGALAQQTWTWATSRTPSLQTAGQPEAIALSPQTWIALYLVLNYAANWLPWARVDRCLFIYHYMGSATFSFLAIAWIISQWLQSFRREWRAIGITIIFVVLLAFVFWLPIYLGLPLSPDALRLRRWLPSWI